MPDSIPDFAAFLNAYPSYRNTQLIDDLRAAQYARLDAGEIDRHRRRRLRCGPGAAFLLYGFTDPEADPASITRDGRRLSQAA